MKERERDRERERDIEKERERERMSEWIGILKEEKKRERNTDIMFNYHKHVSKYQDNK